MFFRQNKLLLSLLLFFMGCFGSTYAASFGNTDIHGFFSQAYFKTEGAKILRSDSTDGSFDYYEAGINISHQVSSDLIFAAQVISRDIGEDPLNEEPLAIDYLLLNYKFMQNLNTTGYMRIGQFKNPFGYYQELQDIPHLRPSPLYMQTVRNLVLRVRGAVLDIHYDHRMGTFSLNWGYVKPYIDRDRAREATLILGEYSFEYDYRPTLRAGWLSPSGNLSIQYSRQRNFYQNSLDNPFLSLRLSSNGFTENNDLFIQYFYNDWKFSFNYLAINHTADSRLTSKDESIFFSNGHQNRTDLRFTLRSSYQLTDSIRLAITFMRYNEGGNADQSKHRSYLYSRNIDIEWQLSSNILLKGELGSNLGTFTVDGRFDSSPDKYWRQFATQIIYYF